MVIETSANTVTFNVLTRSVFIVFVVVFLF